RPNCADQKIDIFLAAMYQESTVSHWNNIEIASVKDKSRLISCVNVHPLKILNPQPHETTCHVVLSNYGGGMVAGDIIQLRICAYDNSKLFIGSQANSRIFKSEDQRDCKQNVVGTVKDNAVVVLFPEPLVLHEKSSFRQTQRWDLSTNSLLVVADWFNSGRSDNNEYFLFRSLQNEIRITVQGKLALVDRFAFNPATDVANASANFSEFHSCLSLYIAGFPGDSKFEILKAHLQQIEEQSSLNYGNIPKGNVAIAFARANQNTLVVRALGKMRSDLDPLCNLLYQAISDTAVLGYNPFSRRL
uniref:urease accessory protein UreD n=1 Tax=Ohtaekwangia sp. TaxID=2066019 RepID=UPI002FDD350D